MKIQKEAITMISQDKSKIRKGYLGFSFSACLLSPFVQLYRKDFKGALFYFIIFWVYGQFITPYVVTNFGIYAGYFSNLLLWIFCGFTYNKVQMLILLNDHYVPQNRRDIEVLRAHGYYVQAKG